MRERAASGDLTGASASASSLPGCPWPPPPPPTEPGTRLALGTRLGSPAVVVSPAAGDATTWAARQPSSAGDVHEPCAAGCAACAPPWARWVVVRVFPLRRNQSDSSESKIGSRCSWPAGGTVTWPSAASPGPTPFVTLPVPSALGPSLPWTFGPLIGDCGGCGPVPAKAGSLLGPPDAGVRGSAPRPTGCRSTARPRCRCGPAAPEPAARPGRPGRYPGPSRCRPAPSCCLPGCRPRRPRRPAAGRGGRRPGCRDRPESPATRRWRQE